jgi:hypothetical protein
MRNAFEIFFFFGISTNHTKKILKVVYAHFYLIYVN